MFKRPRVAGPAQAARVPGLRYALHTGTSARRHDGVERRRVRGVLPLPARAGSGDRMKSEVRNPKSETNPKPETRNEYPLLQRFGFRVSNFLRISGFGLRTF